MATVPRTRTDMPHMDLSRFKSSVRKGGSVPAGTIVDKALTVKIDAIAGAERRKLFTISTASVDRDNDTVALDAWRLENYMRNPVVLWGHEMYAPPIGRSVEIGIDGDALKAIVEFVPADMPCGVGDQAEMVWRMCDGGFISACSVGFIPIKYNVAKERMGEDDWMPPLDFTEVDLMEWSVCTVPANPEATISPQERAANIEVIKAERALREARAIEAERLERVRRRVRYSIYD